MIFSELKFISEATGLHYDEDNGILIGKMNNIPIAVFDNKRRHRFDIVCPVAVPEEDLKDISAVTMKLPKKTLLGIDNDKNVLKIYCKDYPLMQENLPILEAFLDRLTSYINAKGYRCHEPDTAEILKLADFAVIARPKSKPIREKRDSGKINPEGIRMTLKGVLGGIIGLVIGCAIFVVFILLSDLIGWIGGVVMSAAVISMYTVFSHKLKSVDAIITSVMVIVGWLFSNGFAYLFRIFILHKQTGEAINLFGILNNIEFFATKYYEQTNLAGNNLLVSFVFVVGGAVGSYFFYYKHHARDMY